MARQYVVMTGSGAYRHLGSVEGGMKTACGKLLDRKGTMIEQPDSVGIGCLACQRTAQFREAVATKQVLA